MIEVDGGPLYGYTGSGLRAWRQAYVEGPRTLNQYDGDRLLAASVDKIELAPETLEVEIRFKVPEPVVD